MDCLHETTLYTLQVTILILYDSHDSMLQKYSYINQIFVITNLLIRET